MGLISSVSIAEERRGEPRTRSTPEYACPPGWALASGPPDPAIFSPEVSRDLRGHWCETYDAQGKSRRLGRYWEADREGAIRTEGTYVDSQLAGPIVAYHENGSVFLRGFLRGGEWDGTFELFDDRGSPWFQANFRAGRLDGLVRTLHADGKLESEARFQRGREDGLARSFYATEAGGRLKSEAHIEADDFVGVHRVFDRRGRLVRLIDWSSAPRSWPVSQATRNRRNRPPAAASSTTRDAARSN